ncbi:MAG TPA: hypothetical protein VIO64_22795 [Pseudobacteroides sp.]|uniref:hypothetical protein n=1 Tax=Pseudobacteroides sp. TaxID=1968840 RepID=UPI002F927469
METNQKIIEKIDMLKSNLGAKKVKALQIYRLENILNKLTQYSDGCSECKYLLSIFESQLLNNLDCIDKSHLKNYMITLKKIISHLHKKHKLITAGHYIGIYMSMGTSLGMLCGMVIGLISNKGEFQSIGMSLGMCFGMSIGILIGTIKDSNAKKKGNVI